MSEPTDNRKESGRDELVMERLFKLAGPRDPVPTEVEDRVYAKVRAEWRVATQEPDDRRVYEKVRQEWRRDASRGRQFRWALAASVVVAVAVAASFVLRSPSSQPAGVVVGTVAMVLNPTGRHGVSDIGRVVVAGERLSTGPGEGVSLLLATAESIRLDEESTLLVRSKHEFELISGRLYVDSGDRIYRSSNLLVDTRHGTVTDVGTQFIVASSSDVLDVAVREGRVNVEKSGVSLVAIAGERMRLPSSGQAETSALESHDSYWAWAADLAPSFDTTNRSLLDFLRWAARETGRTLKFEDEELRMAAMRAELHGSVAGFKPIEAIEAVMDTTSFRYRIEPAQIVIIR